MYVGLGLSISNPSRGINIADYIVGGVEPSYVADGARNFYSFDGGDTTLPAILDCGRTSSAYIFNAADALESVGATITRRTKDPAAGWAIQSEYAATNLVQYSSDFTQGGSTGGTATVTYGVLDPTGGLGASTLAMPSENDLRSQNTVPITVLVGETYIASIYIKAPLNATARVSIDRQGGGVSEGTAADFIGTGLWERYSIAHTFSNPQTRIKITVIRATGQTATSVDIWGAQCELGDKDTSYQPTEGAAATRAADDLSKSVTSLGISSTATLSFSGVTLTDGVAAQVSDGTDNNRLVIRRSGGNIIVEAIVGGVAAGTKTTAIAAGTAYKAVVAISPTTAQATIDGVAATEAVITAMPALTIHHEGQSNAGDIASALNKLSAIYPSTFTEAQAIEETS